MDLLMSVLVYLKRSENMSRNECEFFEKLMEESKKTQKQEEEKCKACSYGICDECIILERAK